MMSGKRILIIENDDATRMAFGHILSAHGYNVELTTDGSEGLGYLQSHDPPDLIILDMLMHGMDGWQFLKYRDAHWYSVPVLIATALSVASKEWAVAMGANALLQKPVDETQLLRKVGQCLSPPALV